MTVFEFTGRTKGPIPVEKVLDAAKKCKAVIVIGVLEDDSYYYASSIGSQMEMLWMTKKFEIELIRPTETE